MNSNLNRNAPLVSIGVPVFNEQEYIRDTLISLVGQSYKNIEIIISDNCSTDATGEICKEFAEKYQNVSYFLREENIGPAANFNKVLELAHGEYFMWASGHDLWDLSFIEKCVETYAQKKNAVLVFGSSNWINAESDVLDKEFGWSDTRGLHVIARYITVFWGHMNPILGLIKKDQLEENIMLGMAGADLVILSRLAVRGEFVFAEGAHWSRRDFRMEKAYSEKLKRYKSKSYGLTGQSFISRMFPLLQLPIELSKVVLQAKLPVLDKSVLFLLLLMMFPFRYITGRFLQ